MSSVNPHYTFNYAQPDQYRFSHDSVFLARRAFVRTGARLNADSRVLDLCAGCGIVGLDYLWHVRAELKVEPAACDFIEIQDEYATSFAENARRFGPTRTRLRLKHLNYADFAPDRGYDVVLCNPPYFRVGTGHLSPSRFATRCRFFVDADCTALEACVKRSLNVGGEAFVLAREPARHAFAPAPGVRPARLDDIRGTALWHVRRDALEIGFAADG